MQHVMMKCGCVSHSVCSSHDGKKFDPPIPSCVVHDCLEVADSSPDLSGRIAQCSYLPKGHAPKRSSLDLAFFEYKGQGSPDSTNICKCGYHWIAHQQRWKAEIKIIRRWFKIDPYEEIVSREFNSPEDYANEKAEKEADFFRKQTFDSKTKVYSAEVLSLKKIQNTLKCKQFREQGPQEFDQYYCGCHGWD